MTPDGSPVGVPELEPAMAINTATKVPRPRTTQMISSTNAWGLARKKRIRGCTGAILAGSARMLE